LEETLSATGDQSNETWARTGAIDLAIYHPNLVTTDKIQGDSGGKVDILGRDSIGPCEEKFPMNMCLILNGY
jgi:hypothetical protein